MAKPISATIIAGFKGSLSSIKHVWQVVLLAVLVLLAGVGGWVYSIRARQVAVAAEESAFQTATVQQGELVLSASGSGVLVAAEEISLAFSASAQVTGVFVRPGDRVEAGALLAQVDDQDAQSEYTKAKRTYQDLTSAVAVASVQQQVAQMQTDLLSSRYQLEYLISPDVLYWETEIAKGDQMLKEAEASAGAYPSEKEVQQALAKAKAYLSFAQDKLREAWRLYDDEYVPETFRLIEDGNDKDVYAVPTDLEIQLARTAIDEARKKLIDSQDYYNVLTGAPIPEHAGSDDLIELQQAERDFQDARAVLDGAKLYAPISGTILSVDASVGNTAGTTAVITMADLSQLALDFYLDESDWSLVSVGDRAEITFDVLTDRILTGEVTQLDAELYQSGNTSVVRGVVQLDSVPDGIDLPIGVNATVDVIHARVENALLVPLEALHEITPGEYAVILVNDGSLIQRTVEIGLQDQFYAEVKSGLQAGDIVSTSAAELQ